MDPGGKEGVGSAVDFFPGVVGFNVCGAGVGSPVGSGVMIITGGNVGVGVG